MAKNTVELYNSAPTAQIILVDGVETKVKASKSIETEDKGLGKRYPFMVSKKECEKIEDIRDNGKKMPTSDEQNKILKSEMTEMSSMMDKMAKEIESLKESAKA